MFTQNCSICDWRQAMTSANYQKFYSGGRMNISGGPDLARGLPVDVDRSTAYKYVRNLNSLLLKPNHDLLVKLICWCLCLNQIINHALIFITLKTWLVVSVQLNGSICWSLSSDPCLCHSGGSEGNSTENQKTTWLTTISGLNWHCPAIKPLLCWKLLCKYFRVFSQAASAET